MRESDDFVDCVDTELDELFDEACEKAEVIAAVRFERGGGHGTRKVEHKPGKFKNLRKTFAGSNNVNGNQRGPNQQQTAGASKFKVFADVFRVCHNDRSMTRKKLHLFPMCQNNKAQTNGKGHGKKRAYCQYYQPKLTICRLSDRLYRNV